MQPPAARGAALLAVAAFLRIGSMRGGDLYAGLLGILSVVAIVGAFWFLQRDPSAADGRQRRMIYAAFGAILVSWLLHYVETPLGDALPVAAWTAVVALPLWRLARWERGVFAAAAATAIGLGLYAWLGDWAPGWLLLVWVPFLLLTVGAGAVAFRLSRGKATRSSPFDPGGYVPRVERFGPPRSSKPQPRLVIAQAPRTLSEQEKAARLAALEERFQRGELPEHIYLDKRQEIESL